jgi:hypothetical protein
MESHVANLFNLVNKQGVSSWISEMHKKINNNGDPNNRIVRDKGPERTK